MLLTISEFSIFKGTKYSAMRKCCIIISLFFLTVLILFTTVGCDNQPETEPGRIMPGGTVPDKLFVLDVKSDMDWADKNLLSCFQGLVNRKKTRIYYNGNENDVFWLEYYKKSFGIDYQKIAGTEELFQQFAGEIDGYILYPPESPHLLNIATTIGSLENLLPATPAQEVMLKKFGLTKKRELNYNGEDMVEIYRKAALELLPGCNKTMLAALCVHEGQWPTSTYKNRDYVIAHKVFSFDISSSERDKADFNLLKEIYSKITEGAILFGWHCSRDKEHEAIGLASDYGHYGMCSLNTSNLTVHSSIPMDRKKVFRQRSINPSDLKVENKVYMALMATDGDAAWFMQNHVTKDWADPAHGNFKYNWGFLPLAYDLMPGTVQYYMENMKPADYFVSGPAGATYTYPYRHPHPEKFLKISNDYMKKCGLTTVHMTNWNDRDWWQEAQIPGFYDLMKRSMPDATGFARGMGESAFEESYLGNGQPYIFIGEGIHIGDDVTSVIKDFISACPNRPLFVFNLVNHSIPMGKIKEATDLFSKSELEIVHLDELILLADKAFKEGKITADLYPEKEGLKKILSKEAKLKWPALMKELKDLDRISSGDAAQFGDSIKKTPIGLERVLPADILAFNTIWHSMTLVKLSLEAKGIYVNHKPTAVRNFMKEYAQVADAEVINELQQLWEGWHQQNPTFEDGQKLLKRLAKVAEQVSREL
jgi:hypothetical protein